MDDDEEVDIQYVSLRFLYRELLWLQLRRSQVKSPSLRPVLWCQHNDISLWGRVEVGRLHWVCRRERAKTLPVSVEELWSERMTAAFFSQVRRGNWRSLILQLLWEDPSSPSRYLCATSLHFIFLAHVILPNQTGLTECGSSLSWATSSLVCPNATFLWLIFRVGCKKLNSNTKVGILGRLSKTNRNLSSSCSLSSSATWEQELEADAASRNQHSTWPTCEVLGDNALLWTSTSWIKST